MSVMQFPHHYRWQPLDLPTHKPLPMLSPLERVAPFAGTLTDEEVQWLLIGAGRIDMDLKWMFRLGDDGMLRLFRSWSGFEHYRARVINKWAGQWVLTDLNVESDKRRVGNHAQLADSFEAVLNSCLALRKTVTNIPSSPEDAAAATIQEVPSKIPGLQSLEWELDRRLPARVVTLRLGDEQAHLRNVLAVKASVDHDCVRIDFDDGGHLWLRQPWRWAWLPDDCAPHGCETDSSMFWMTSGGALLWPGPQWGIDPEVAVWSAVTLPGGVQATKLSTSGKKIECHNNTGVTGDATATITFSPPWVSRDAIAFAAEEPWTRHLSTLWRQVALLGADPPPCQTTPWAPPARPAHLATFHDQDSKQEWMAWWAPALHLLVYVLGCKEPFAVLARRLDGDREDDHEAWALLESWWGADLRGFAAWGLRERLDSYIAEELHAFAQELCVAAVAFYGSLADRPEAWTRLAIDAGVVLGREGDSFHLRYHFLSPLEETDDCDFLIPDEGPLVLNVPDYRGWYRALLEFGDAAERPVEVRIRGWGTLGTFARPARGQLPRLVPTTAPSPAQLTTHPTSAGLESFSPYVQEHVGWYVYLLRDPRDNHVFYVGKGIGNRVFEHSRDAAALPDSDKPKLALIRAIHEAGLNVQTELVRHHIPNEKMAHLVEATVLDAMASIGQALSNEVVGHHSDLYGWASTVVGASIYEAPPMSDQAGPLLLLEIPPLWTPAMSDSDLYEATRGWWVLAKRGLRARYAVAVNHGVTRGVFRIEYWRERVPGDRDYSPEDKGLRLGFAGSQAPEMAYLLNRSIKHLPQPSGGALVYINCNNLALADRPCYRGRGAVEMAAWEARS